MAATLPARARERLREGLVIPAHPLSLTESGALDERRQRALTRYYLAAGAGGVAVGVHTTQFAIREHGLLRPVLELAAATVREATLEQPIVTVAGVCGPLPQALAEARLAAELGYDLALVSLGALPGASENELVEHIAEITSVLPVFGFYLQPSVGGRRLGYDFWRRLADLEGVESIKIAPFNRYQTVDVVRAVCESSRAGEIALYTGNDDNFVADLLTPFRIAVGGGIVEKRIVGGLLGQWAVWTRRAVGLLDDVRRAGRPDGRPHADLLAEGAAMTEANAAVFDAANDFRGCIPGIHELLRRQGLMGGRACLDPDERLSPGQADEIDRVCRRYPHLTDDEFVGDHLRSWLDT